MEELLLATALRSRASFELISSHLKLEKYRRAFQIVWEMVANYYKRDANAQSVQPDILFTLIADTVRNPKHVAEFTDVLAAAVAADVSEVNVETAVLAARQAEVADELAVALTNGEDTRELIEQYTSLQEATSLAEVAEGGVDELDLNDLSELLAVEADARDRLVVYPEAISERIAGGASGGHHIVIFARPEAGKTALAISIACGFARQGAPGLYLGNEDRPQDILVRMMSNLTGRTRADILRNPDEATQQAKETGLNNIRLVSMSPGTPQQIEAYIKKYRPRWMVIDQLRNIAVKSDSRVNQLEAAATFARNMAKKYNIIVISITQAGDSASHKEVLDMGDVDFSNTGIPAQADVMIGLGVNENLERQGLRMISLPKNKLGGDHAHFLVRIHPFLSRVSTIR